jgi:hypothetical protein
MRSEADKEQMSDDRERGPAIIDAHQELVGRIEQSAGRMRALSVVTIIVAAVLAVAYLSQLLLPVSGTTTVTVNLTDPVNVASEVVVMGLAVAWLYVGVSDFRFSSRVRREVSAARSKEKSIQDRVS